MTDRLRKTMAEAGKELDDQMRALGRTIASSPAGMVLVLIHAVLWRLSRSLERRKR